ncbi:MAG: GerMN domain-containing protein [Sporomusa sp.]
MKKNVRLLIMAMLMVLTFTIAGCDRSVPVGQTTAVDQAQTSGQASPAKVTPGTGRIMHLVAYYATKDAMYLVPEVYEVPVNSRPARTAMEFLLAGPKSSELVGVMPPGVKLKNLSIKDHVAYVDFNDAIIKNNTGGSASEILLVGAIVNTLTEFPDIQQVQILVDGKKVETISGHLATGEPLSRSEKIIKKQ